jgi:hypothetical protein
MKMKKILLIMLLFSMGCDEFYNIPDLVTPRRDFTGNSIRLDGIYYNNKDDQFFLYRNGVYQSACFDKNISKIPDRFECSLGRPQGYIGAWRIFVVTQDTIYLEGWGLVGSRKHNIFSYTGKILNDTTLVIPTDIVGLNRDTFRFAKFGKPDSTNDFIK